MNRDHDTVLAIVVDAIRRCIDEDWVHAYDIQPQTRLNQDLEIESIEFVKIASAVMEHFGDDLDIVGWLSGKSMQELIDLSVGDVAALVVASQRPKPSPA